MRRKMSSSALVAMLILAALVFRITDMNPAMAQTQRVGAWSVSSDPGLDGSSPEWQSIPPVFLPATAQQVTPPIGGGAVERIAVRAVHWEDRLYMMLEWTDLTPNAVADRTEHFSDSAAIQFPAVAGSAVPNICMGQADQAVNIWHWRSDQQHLPPALPEGGYVDLYPSTDDLYFPAREAGNPLAQTEGRTPAQNLVAGGFGTLTAVDNGGLEGYGQRIDNRWAVVFSRSFAPTGDLQPEFGTEPIDVAFAVWDGERQERDGIKSVSTFTQLTISPLDAPRRPVPASGDWPAYTPPGGMLELGAIGMLVLLIAAGGGLIWISFRQALKRADEA
jgi:hypothetical protein